MIGDHLRLGAQALAAIVGGPGIFYLWLSFYEPREALTALLCLGVATALVLAAPAPQRSPTKGAGLRQLLAPILRRRRRGIGRR